MRRFPVAIALVWAASACGGSEVTNVDLSADSGIYTLQSMNGSVLPYLIGSSTNYSLTLTAESIDVGASGAFRDVVALKEISNGILKVYSDTTSGSWTERGALASFTSNEGVVTQGTITGNVLTITGRDQSGAIVVAIYRK